MELRKSIKIPMLAGIILQAVAAAIGIVCYLMQAGIGTMRHAQPGVKVFPDTLIGIFVGLLMHIICFLVMQTYEGESERMIGIIMAVLYCVVNIGSTYLLRVSQFFDSRRGAEFLAAKSLLASMISLLTSPFSFISLVLVLIAVGRYGTRRERDI